MICPVSVEGEVLGLLGFKPASKNVEYRTTSVEWTKNDFGNTWILKHNSHDVWELTIDISQNGESQPLRRKSEIGWISQIQHCMSNLNMMELTNK